MEGPRPHLHVIGLQDDAALLAPIAMQGEDQILEAHLLTGEERSTIEERAAKLEAALAGGAHRAIKKAIDALNHGTETFAARRMDEGVRRALAGRKIGSL